MTRQIVVWIFFVSLFTVTTSARSDISTSTVNPILASGFTKVGSGGKCTDLTGAKSTSHPFAAAVLALPQADACADPIDACRNPVKYLGANGDCACFACEYGKSTQHNVCTRKQPDKDTLLKRAK